VAKRKQHFIPEVYLKRWSHCGNDSVYYYKKSDLSIGNPRNVSTILLERHTYTVTYDDFFTLDYMPKIKQDFTKQINEILHTYNAIAFYNSQQLNTDELLMFPENLGNIDKWVFKKADNIEKLAPKKAIIANIKEIRSYVLENALDDYIEKKWNSLLDTFIEQIETGYNLRIADEDIVVKTDTIEGIISTLLLFVCRNPQFDCQGIFPRIENVLLSLLLESAENIEQEQEIREFIDGHMRGAWLSQIYKALFNNDISFFRQYFLSIKKRCQVTVMKCSNENGSFITSDNPAFPFVNFVTKANYNAIYFPLTPNYLLVIGNGQKNSLNKIDIKVLTNEGIRRFNGIILSKANEAIISNKKYLGFIV